jgi:signal transduction histidine kinase
MSLTTLLEPIYLLQTIAVALSVFNLVAFLWLALTVWLNGDRHSLIARVGVVGLGMAALFFFIHALLIANPFAHAPGLVSADFLWRLIWLPALVVPYIWFVIGLHYASLVSEQWRRRRPLLLICSGLLGCAVLVSLIFNRTTFTFAGTIRLLAYGDVVDAANVNLFSLLVLPMLFLCYLAFCAIGPWFTSGRIGHLSKVLWLLCQGRLEKRSLRQRLADAFWDGRRSGALLNEPGLSWHLARPILLFAALLMVGLVVCLGSLSVRSMLHGLRLHGSVAGSSLHPPATLSMIPPNLVLLDIFSTGLVAVIVLLFGYSIVRHGILIERPLARRGFFEQWRGIVIVATAVALFIAIFVQITGSSLSGLLLITSLATGAYALFTWSSYTAHDRYIAMLGPFLRSTTLRYWLNTDLQKTEHSMEDLFFHLCQDVLDIQCARLIVLAGPVKRSFDYRWSSDDRIDDLEKSVTADTTGAFSIHSHEQSSYSDEGKVVRAHAYRVRMLLQGLSTICWVLPIYDDLGLVAKLYLGPRQDGAVFTNEDMELAHACGQRILDTLRDHEAMLAVAGLLRRRIVDVKLLGAQQRRVLHDEILPHMHLALLKLETLRAVVHTTGKRQTSEADSALDEVIDSISDAHRRLAAMMRATTTGAPHRLERDGLMHAIHTMIEHDFHQAFDEVRWNVSEETAQCIDEIVPPAIAELLFAAVQEALRNAARHGRGSDVHRRLCLTLSAFCHPSLEVIVADDGVGIMAASSSTTGTGGGLLTHSALLAVAGGNLAVKSLPEGGVTVRILLPAEVLR